MLGVLLWDRHELDSLFDGKAPAVANENDYWEQHCASANRNM